MVALDLDGTLLTSDRKVTERTRRAFAACRERGVYIVISTGRAYTSLPEDVREMSEISYAITSNGAHICYAGTGESIYDDYLHPAAVREAARLYEELDCEIEIFIDGQAYVDESYYNYVRDHGCAYRSAEYVLWSRKPVKDIAAYLLDNEDRIENVNFCFRTVDMLDDARGMLEAIPYSTVTSSFPNNMEVGGPNTSKKTALQELLRILGISPEELMCCGDAPNDIRMIEFAGLGVAVGNAWGGTKEHADYITASNDEDGVALAIEKFVLTGTV